MKLLEFIVKRALQFDLLSAIINVQDYVGIIPLYYLCERGYDKDPESGQEPKEHKDRVEMILLLIPDNIYSKPEN